MIGSVRVLVAGGAAFGLVVGLALVVPTRSISPEPAARPAPPPARPSGVLARLRGRAMLLYVVRRAADVPGDGPVVAVGRYGARRLARPPGIPERPDPGPWLAAGVVVPCSDLGDLSRRARAAFLDSLAALAGRGRAVDPDALVLLGVRAHARTLERLLRWCR